MRFTTYSKYVPGLAEEMNLHLGIYLKEFPVWPSAGSSEETAALRELRFAAHPD